MTTHEAVADVIKAAGFDTMAREYLEEPEKRPRIINAMRRNIISVSGLSAANRFAHLARRATA